ncbi:MAG: SIS domain-containing protein, partial [Candidatus Thorarchaeota archaeon]
MRSMVTSFPSVIRASCLSPSLIDEASVVADADIGGICLLGMGGSSIAGQMCRAIVQSESSIPIVTVSDYTLPRYVDHQWAVIAVSYSGNTEETINGVKEALARDSYVFAITSGGELEKMVDKKRLHLIPGGWQPRAALPLMFPAVYQLCTKIARVDGEDMEEVGKAVADLSKQWGKTKISPVDLAARVRNRLPVFIG